VQKAHPSLRGSVEEGRSALGRWLDRLAIPSPIAQIDHYLVLIRWEVILAIGIISLFRGFQSSALLPPLAALPAVIAYNLPVSFYAWRRQPLANGQVGWLLPGDLLQSTLAVAFTGGYHSFYFILFLLVIMELALAFPWRIALALAISSDALQVGAMVLYRSQQWEPFAAYMVVAKFFISLIVGGMAILFSELVRREDAARQEAARRAARTAALNAIFVHLGESGLNLERTLEAILNSTHTLPDVAFSLVLLPDSTDGSWRVAASDTDRHPVGERVIGMADDGPGQTFFSAGTDSPHPLPPFVAEDAIDRLTGVHLRSPEGEILGALIVGWQSGRSLDDDEQAFLQSLALEAGLALYSARLYAQEREHVARLQRFEALQSTFFSAIGHELKTPLAVLKMLVPSLRQLPQLPAAMQAEIAESIEQSLGRLETLITDLLESSRLEAGAIALHPHAVDLVWLTQRVLDELAPLLSRKNQRVTLQVEPNLPQVWADSRRVEQVLSNLMGNAIKFAPPESTIDVQLCPVEGAVQVCVADVGPGVPLEERERIFNKFYTATENKALAGAGLGLFICRELVRLHGGSIWVEERPGGGSRFCFTLPVVRGGEIYEEDLPEDFEELKREGSSVFSTAKEAREEGRQEDPSN